MTEETRLSYDANHVFREGYDKGYADALEYVSDAKEGQKMYEPINGPKRLANALSQSCDDHTLQVLARELNYVPEQLKQDIEALKDLSLSFGKLTVRKKGKGNE